MQIKNFINIYGGIMNKINFSNFVKKILVILLVVLIFNGQTIAFARAGGGRSSTSHSSSNSRSHSNTSSTRLSRKPTLIETIIIITIFIVVCISANTIIRKVRLGKKKYKSISVIQNLSKCDDNWNCSDIKKDIEAAFYMIQIAWRKRNQDLAKEYMSDYLYSKHKLQTEGMKIRKEKNILENMILLGATPIGLQDLGGINKDYIWVHIKAKGKDYTINEEANEVIKGKVYGDVHFEEYWKFIRKEKRWVLDDIRQIDDITDLDFFRIEAPNKYD